MTTITPRPARSHRRRAAHARLAPLPSVRLAGEPVSRSNRHQRGGTVVFEVSFSSAMTGRDLELLRRLLDMTTHPVQKMRPDPNSPGVARLDHFSGLFLERGAAEDQWLLQARTWGTPAAQTIHDWHVLAAQVARQLDPRVAPVERVLQA